MLLIKQSLFAHFFFTVKPLPIMAITRTMLPMMPHALFSAIDTPISIMLKTAANANNNKSQFNFFIFPSPLTSYFQFTEKRNAFKEDVWYNMKVI